MQNWISDHLLNSTNMHEGYLTCTWNYNLYDPHSVENEKTTSMMWKENTSLILCLKSQTLTNYIEKATDWVTFITVKAAVTVDWR